MSASGHGHRNSVQSAIRSPAQARGSDGHGSIDEPGDTLNSEAGQDDPLDDNDLNQIEKFLEQDGHRNSRAASQQKSEEEQKKENPDQDAEDDEDDEAEILEMLRKQAEQRREMFAR